MLVAVKVRYSQPCSRNLFNLRVQFGINLGKVYLTRIRLTDKFNIIIRQKPVAADKSRHFTRREHGWQAADKTKMDAHAETGTGSG